jgi:adenylate cyclase
VPGVHIHAGAVAAVAGGDLTVEAQRETTAGVAAAAAMLGCYLGFATAPVIAFGTMMVALILMLGAGVALLAAGIWLPLAVPVLALLASLSLTYSVRFTLESRQRRRITAAFGHYLAPSIVQVLAEGGAPTLGGETREITVMFADLSGFTAMSGRMPPEELVALTNSYLRLIVEEVERTGGYVDKFIGDAVMAFWNAPLDDANHVGNAVDSALAAVRRIEAQSAGTPEGEPRFSVKIGIETGQAVVGNVGTEGRCNYTAVGETVNVAARLESVPGDYRCYVAIGERAAARLSDAFLLRELDAIVLRGRSEPLRIYEPIARRQRTDDRQSEAVERFADALRLYRDRRFAEAQSLWAQLVEGYAAAGLLPGPASVMAARAAKLAEEPPGPDWSGVWVKQSK